MSNKHLDIASVAKIIGSQPDYVQGGGGNVSIKIDGEIMAVKASGYRLEDINEDDGLVAINYTKLREYYKETPSTLDLPTLISQNDQKVTEHTISSGQGPTLRPSIETGFHAILGESVIHTHSVYANLLNCSEEGFSIIKKLFPEAIFVPYHTPGIALTYAIYNLIQSSPSDIIFLENHGLIVVGNNPELAAAAHERVNKTIKEYFNLNHAYPTINLIENADHHFSHTPYLEDISRQRPEIISTFTDTILFPDQVVYGEQVSFTKNNIAPLTIDLETGQVICSGSSGFARAAVETLVAWTYLMDNINKLGLTTKKLPQTEGAFIANLDSEKYRKDIL